MGAILAGGRATRFGGAAKGLERVGDARIIDAVAAVLARVTDALMVVSNADDAPLWLPGVPVVRDVHPGVGSLGGVHAALAHADGRDTLVVAWDMPFVPTALAFALRARGAAGDVDAVIPRVPAAEATTDDDARHSHAEPLCAWYAAGCLATAERLVEAGERRALALGEAVTTAWVDPTPFGDPVHMFLNVNTPAELARARDLSPPG